MEGNITLPIKAFTAVLIGIACLILIITQLAGIGLGGASLSTALVSANTTLTNGLPFFAAMLGGGLVLWAMEGKRR